MLTFLAILKTFLSRYKLFWLVWKKIGNFLYQHLVTLFKVLLKSREQWVDTFWSLIFMMIGGAEKTTFATLIWNYEKFFIFVTLNKVVSTHKKDGLRSYFNNVNWNLWNVMNRVSQEQLQFKCRHVEMAVAEYTI